MKIVLLGATGFAGQNVYQQLKKENFEVHAVSRHIGYDLTSLHDNIRFCEEKNPDVIINCAAHVGSLNYVTEFAGDVLADNSAMILNLYQAVKQVNKKIRIIQPLANCAYPANAVVYKEDEFWNGALHPSVMSYGFTRRLMWTIAECYKMQYNIRTVNLVTPNMYGPFDSTDPNKAHALNALVSKFVKAIYTNQQQVEVWGTGVAIREWLFAGDFARIVLEVLADIENENYYQPVNIAQEHGLSVKELIDLILAYVPYKGDVYYNKEKPDGAPRKVMSKERFSKIFPDFKFTSFEEGIMSTAAFYQSVYPY